jgi:hypothetical protein
MRKHSWVIAALLVLLGSASIAKADTIDSYTSGTAMATDYFGESFTTPSGGPWDSITFSFYSDVPPATPAAAGDLFLLTEEYLGDPAGLSSSTPGLLAESVSNAGGIYTFSSPVTLAAGTEYWVYTDASLEISGSGTGGSSAGEAYFAATSTTDFSAFGGGQITNFTLQGTTSVPEPPTYGLMLLGIGAVLVLRKRTVQGFHQAS